MELSEYIILNNILFCYVIYVCIVYAINNFRWDELKLYVIPQNVRRPVILLMKSHLVYNYYNK